MGLVVVCEVNENRQTKGTMAVEVRYRRVPHQDQDVEQDHQDKKRQAERVERIVAKVHALFWVALACALVYFTDFLALVESDRVNR
jgi:sugar phosphate permease